MALVPARDARALVAVMVAVGLAGATAACGKNESATTPSSTVTAASPSPVSALAAPAVIEPSPNATLSARPTFLVTNAAHPAGVTSLTYHLDIASDAALLAILQQADIPERTSGTQTVFTIPTNLPAGTAYWRIRSVDQSGRASAPTPVQSFSVGAPFLDLPTLASPDNGAVLHDGRPTLTFIPGRHWGRPANVSYDVQVATSSDFGSLAFAVSQVGSSDAQMTMLPSVDLPPGTYVWRVRSHIDNVMDPATGNLITLTTAFTPGRSFAIAETILAPKILAPAGNAMMHSSDALTVANAVRTGGVGPFSYRFDIASSLAFSPIVATGTVTEGPGGQTSFAVPDLPIGAYAWRVVAIDQGSLGTSPPSGSGAFTVVSAAARVLSLEIDDPGATSCGGASSITVHTWPVATTDPSNGPRVHITSVGSLAADLTIASGEASGTIAGSAPDGLYVVELSSSPNATTPVTLNGHVDRDGTMTGSLDGFIRLSNSFGDADHHQMCGARWRITPGG